MRADAGGPGQKDEQFETGCAASQPQESGYAKATTKIRHPQIKNLSRIILIFAMGSSARRIR
jgi:hypothetical protein